MNIIYAGNRSFALECILNSKINNLFIYALKKSFLMNYANKNNLKYETFSNKNELYKLLKTIDKPSLFISCGVPFLIDINIFPKISFINIHPSLLPSLKGRDPAIGSLIKKLKLGVTIHKMNMQFDSGEILWQSDAINIEENMDIKDVYSISFMLEKKAGEVISNGISREGISKFINYSEKNIIFEEFKNKEYINSYFNRSVHYGNYKDFYSNEDLILNIKSASLNNFGTKALLKSKKFEKVITIFSGSIIERNNLNLINLFGIAEYLDNIVIYALENRLTIYREKKIILLTIKESMNFSYIFNTQEIIYLREII